MAAWDLSPTFNPDTGLPHSFIEMPLGTHLLLWRFGPRHLLPQSRYAALLVSMHGARLYERRDLDRLSAADADAVREFLDEQREFQKRLLVSLAGRSRDRRRGRSCPGRPEQRPRVDLGPAVAGPVP